MRSFYHGTATPLEVGDTYIARSAKIGSQAIRMGRVLTARETVEKLFEKYRPKGKPSRQKSFFLAASPSEVERLGASSAKYLYRVQALGGARGLHRGDFEWLWQAGSLDMAWKMGMGASLFRGIVSYLPWQQLPSKIEQQATLKKLVGAYWQGKRSDSFKGWEYLAPKILVVEGGRA